MAGWQEPGTVCIAFNLRTPRAYLLGGGEKKAGRQATYVSRREEWISQRNAGRQQQPRASLQLADRLLVCLPVL